MNPVWPRLMDCHSVRDALADLCNGFAASHIAEGACQPVSPEEIPEPFGSLLVHHDHMTTRLTEYYGRPPELRVLCQEVAGDIYRRQIVLTPTGSATIIECGLVRIDLSFTTDAVREAILRCAAPLGDILIEHGVLRRIEPRWYLRLEAQAPLLASFDCATGFDVFGRVGTIHCNDRPAIELLEIVTGAVPE